MTRRLCGSGALMSRRTSEILLLARNTRFEHRFGAFVDLAVRSAAGGEDMYLKKVGGTWTIFAEGLPGLSSDDVQRYGVPQQFVTAVQPR